MSDLTPEERAAIGAAHVQSVWTGSAGRLTGHCGGCRGAWPCDAARLLIALTAAEARIATAEGELIPMWQGATERLREAIEASVQDLGLGTDDRVERARQRLIAALPKRFDDGGQQP